MAKANSQRRNGQGQGHVSPMATPFIVSFVVTQVWRTFQQASIVSFSISLVMRSSRKVTRRSVRRELLVMSPTHLSALQHIRLCTIFVCKPRIGLFYPSYVACVASIIKEKTRALYWSSPPFWFSSLCTTPLCHFGKEILLIAIVIIVIFERSMKDWYCGRSIGYIGIVSSSHQYSQSPTNIPTKKYTHNKSNAI